MSTLGVVLAAGAGRRFGGPKALATSDGERWVDRAVRVLTSGGVAEVVVIAGAWNDHVAGAEVCVNPRWEEGLSTSVELAVSLAQERGADRLLLTVVDIPSLTADHVRMVLEAPHRLVQACYAGVPGHPVVISSEHFEGVKRSLSGDVGAREYLLTHGVHDLHFPEQVEDVDFPLSSPYGNS
jgi:CTP:molybdopterin cytidylyltransferase MocA